MRLGREIALFAVGGVLGFLVDAGIVQSLVRILGWNPYAARVPSFLAAASVTWLWNRELTFARLRRHRAASEWLRWMAVMLAGAVVNYGVYALLVHFSATVRAWPALGVAAGSALAATVNFAGARGVVFGAPRAMP
jgi:putative flippase GtrA